MNVSGHGQSCGFHDNTPTKRYLAVSHHTVWGKTEYVERSDKRNEKKKPNQIHAVMRYDYVI